MNSQLYSVLIVSSDRDLLRRAAKFLEVCGFAVSTAARDDLAAQVLAATPPDFLILDPVAGTQAALGLSRAARKRADGGQTFTLLLVDKPSVQDLLDAVQAGCDDFLSRPVAFGEWLARLKAGARALEFERRRQEQAGVDPATGLTSRAALRRRLNEIASQNSPTASLVLIQLDGAAALRTQLGAAAFALQIRQAALLLAEQAPPQSLPAAWSDHTLALLWPGQREADAADWAESWRKSLGTPAEVTQPQTWSVGVAACRSGQNSEAWTQATNLALALAVQSGGDCVATSRECQENAEAWSADAAAGKLFATTTAGDVMSPCPLVLSRDETVEAAAALLKQTALAAAPVVDDAGNYVGVVTLDELTTKASRAPAGRQSGSVRLLRHFLSADAPRFEERTSLAELLDSFATDPQPFAVVLAHRKPLGLVYCDALANLSERLLPESLRPSGETTAGSEYLLVPAACDA